MKSLISAATLAIIVVSHIAFAQDSSNTSHASTKHQAPVGHRQPTVADVERALAEKGITGSAVVSSKSSDIDQRLIICQGC
jgi:hypothetical protein